MGYDTGYGGWTNWETWHTKLLVDNEYSTNKDIHALARRCAEIKLGRVTGKVFDHEIAVNAFKRKMAWAWRETRQYAIDNEWTVNQPNWTEITDSYIEDEIDEIKREERH